MVIIVGCGMEVKATRVIVGGLIIYVEKEDFLNFLSMKEKPIVVVGESGGFRKFKIYITTFDGSVIVYRGNDLELPENCIIVTAQSLSVGGK
jgi:hypothetical protein